MKILRYRGFFTHFATADEKNKYQANKQFEKFSNFVEYLHGQGIDFEIQHCKIVLLSLICPIHYKDMVRLGIAMYGMYPSYEVEQSKVDLKPALELKSHVTMVKSVEAGQKVSYGGIFETTKHTVLATVSVGYGDGYPRNLSSKGYVFDTWEKAPIVGRDVYGPIDGGCYRNWSM